MAQTPLDFNRICRACKSEDSEMVSIFSGFVTEAACPRIDEMLMACTSLQVNTEDKLPKAMCVKCVEDLKSAYLFNQRCQNTETVLKKYCESVAETPVKEEVQLLEIQGTVAQILQEADNAKPKLNSTPATKDAATEPLDTETAFPEGTDFIELLENNQMVITCRTCFKIFTTLEGLRGHKRMHLGLLFRCRFCDKGFTRQTHLNRHEQSHEKHKLHVCRICNKTVSRMEHLKRHLIIHLKDKPFSCKSCNRGFNRVDHLEVHAAKCKGDRVHICDICNRGFIREDSLQVHRRLHENQKAELPTIENIDNIDEHFYEIDYDPNIDNTNIKTDLDAEDLLEPQVEVDIDENDVNVREESDQHNDDSVDNDFIDSEPIDIKQMLQTDIIINENDITIDEDQKTICRNYENDEDFVVEADDAPASDSTDSEYLPSKASPPKKRGRGRPRKYPVSKSRARTRTRALSKKIDDTMILKDAKGEYPCPLCDEVFNRISLLELHSKSHEFAKSVCCKICNKEFTRFSHFKRHMLSHAVVKPFQCDICQKRFSRRDHLNQHIKLHDKKEYQCDECRKMFHRMDHLKKHKLSKHFEGDKLPSEKKFRCNICPKSFTTEKYRDVHVKAHLGDTTHECKICNKSFLSKSHLTEHMKFHNDHEKKFLCSECGQRFIRNDYLVIHMRRHRGEKPFKCKFCGKGFPRTTDLTVHERYHTGEKTHLCTICGRGFGRAYNLTVHMRTHTGEKPYQCTYCDAAFAQGNDLKAHVRRHTGERFQCELCAENFLMGYLLTQHKRAVHGLNVVSNIRRLQPLDKLKEDTDDPPITIPLPKPVVPELMLSNFQAHLTAQITHLTPLAPSERITTD